MNYSPRTYKKAVAVAALLCACRSREDVRNPPKERLTAIDIVTRSPALRKALIGLGWRIHSPWPYCMSCPHADGPSFCPSAWNSPRWFSRVFGVDHEDLLEKLREYEALRGLE